MKLLFLSFVFLCAGFSQVQAQDFSNDVDELIQSIGIDNQLEVAKEYILEKTLSKNQIAVKKEFEDYKTSYIAAIKEYYLSKYTQAEIHELLNFYTSALGSKIRINSLEYEHIVHEFMDKRLDKYVAILINIDKGKYSKK